MNIEQDNKSMAIIDQFIQSLSNKSQNKREKIKTSLLSAINSSPFLVEAFIQAANNGDHALKKIVTLDPNLEINRNSAASYNHGSNTISIRIDRFDGESANIDKFVYELAHEMRHCLDDKALDEMDAEFEKKVRNKIAYNVKHHLPQPIDFTAELKYIQDKEKQFEGRAEIDGYNALVSRIHHQSPHADSVELNARLNDNDYSGLYWSKKGQLMLENNGMIVSDNSHRYNGGEKMIGNYAESNLQAVSDIYWNRVDRYGKQFYPDKYGAAALERIYNIEKEMIDKYNTSNIEITINTQIDMEIAFNQKLLGYTTEGLSQYLQSNNIYQYHYLDTSTGQKHKLEDYQQPIDLEPLTPRAKKVYTQTHEKLVEYCEKNNITADSPRDYENIAMALTLNAITQKPIAMRKVDNLSMSEQDKELEISIFSYEPDLRYANVMANEVANIPARENMKQILQVEQNIAMEEQRQVMERNRDMGGRSI